MEGGLPFTSDSAREAGDDRSSSSEDTAQSWCVGKARVKGCDILWLRLAYPTPVPDWNDKKCFSLTLGNSAGTTPPSREGASRWLSLTRDWLFVSRMPFKGRYFEAKIPVTALQVMCTPLSSNTQGKGLIVIAANEWWARAAPPPSSSGSSVDDAEAMALIAGDAAMATRMFRASGLRGTTGLMFPSYWASSMAVAGCSRRQRRRLHRRANLLRDESQAFLIECASTEERNWLLYCIQAAAATPPPLGFLRTCVALAEAEYLLQKVACFVRRQCFPFHEDVRDESPISPF